jgi:hypothetical protein
MGIMNYTIIVTAAELREFTKLATSEGFTRKEDYEIETSFETRALYRIHSDFEFVRELAEKAIEFVYARSE